MIEKLGTGIKDFDYRFKIVVIGASGCGKTSLLLRFADSKFTDDHLVTIGVDFKTKAIQIGQKKINLQLWDTAGQEKYKSVTRSYYKKSNGALCVYDITDRKTLHQAESLINYFINESESANPANVVLVGNKYDLATKHRQVSQDEGKQIADKFNVPFYEVSAKKNINVDHIFFEIAMQAMRSSNLVDGELNDADKVKLKRATGEDDYEINDKIGKKGLKIGKLKIPKIKKVKFNRCMK